MTTRRTDPAQTERDKRDKKRIQRENRDDLAKILATAEGGRYMIRLMTRCGVMRSGYDSNGSRAYFDAGIRFVGTELAREIAAIRPELVTKALLPEAAPPPPTEDDSEEDDDHGE